MKVDPLLKRHRSYASSNEVWKYIAELGISKVSISFLRLCIGDAMRNFTKSNTSPWVFFTFVKLVPYIWYQIAQIISYV